MKMLLLSLSLFSTIASANIGGGSYGDGYNPYQLSGRWTCGPEGGVQVELDLDDGTGELKGKSSQIKLELVQGGVQNGNAAYEFVGQINGQEFSVLFESLMGAKVVSFSHPSGKSYRMRCDSVNISGGGF
jgi:hypothetical protein